MQNMYYDFLLIIRLLLPSSRISFFNIFYKESLSVQTTNIDEQTNTRNEISTFKIENKI